jgi:hypothetical protein
VQAVSGRAAGDRSAPNSKCVSAPSAQPLKKPQLCAVHGASQTCFYFTQIAISYTRKSFQLDHADYAQPRTSMMLGLVPS